MIEDIHGNNRFLESFLKESAERRFGVKPNGSGSIAGNLSIQAASQPITRRTQMTIRSGSPVSQLKPITDTATIDHLIPMLAWKEGEVGLIHLSSRVHFEKFD